MYQRENKLHSLCYTGRQKCRLTPCQRKRLSPSSSYVRRSILSKNWLGGRTMSQQMNSEEAAHGRQELPYGGYQGPPEYKDQFLGSVGEKLEAQDDDQFAAAGRGLAIAGLVLAAVSLLAS